MERKYETAVPPVALLLGCCMLGQTGTRHRAGAGEDRSFPRKGSNVPKRQLHALFERW